MYDAVSLKYPAGQLQPLVESTELPARQGLMTDARGSLHGLHEEHTVDPVGEGTVIRNTVSRRGNLALAFTTYKISVEKVLCKMKETWEKIRI